MNDRTFSLNQYPLSWPDGWTRTSSYNRKNQHFKKAGDRLNVEMAVRRVVEELMRIGVKRDDMLISTNCRLRMDGFPRGDENPSDPGVALYWRKKADAPMQCMAVDIYTSVAGNLGGIAASLEALRAIDRHGGTQIQERTYRGFAALPATSSKTWRDVFGVVMTKPTQELIEAQYRSLLKVRHPDVAGGSNGAMAELNVAREHALKEIGL
jgi:hypothetical protein